MSAPQNPPAFPNIGNSAWSMNPTEGMTLRDYYAGQLLASMPDFNVAGTSDAELQLVAAQMYRIADAMLAAREQRA